MKRMRAVLAVATVLATGFILTPFHAVAEDACANGSVLNIVAHHDDDLLFLAPDLIHDIQDEKCVLTVFLVASNYENPARPMTSWEYMRERERGVRDAYAQAAGEDEENWSAGAYHYDPSNEEKHVTYWTLNERVSILEVRIPDNSTEPLGSLWYLYSLDLPVTTVEGDESPAQTFTRAQLAGFLRQVTTDFGPDVIRAGDPVADHAPPLRYGGVPAHQDHLATARMVRWALDGWGAPIVGYRDYTIQDEAPNLSVADITAKTEAFTAFVQHDWDICHSGGTCPVDEWQGELYPLSMERQYYSDPGPNWRGGYIEPLPAPLPGSFHLGPYIRDHVKIKNVATGQELAVQDASQADGAPLITWSSTGTPNQTFQLRAVFGGWEISPLHSKVPSQDRWKCLDIPGASTANGAQVTQFPCGEGIHQALRIIRQPSGYYELVFRHSDMRLTAPPALGGPVTQTYYDGSDYQKWMLVPA